MKLKDSWTTGIEKVGIRRVRGAGYTLTTLPFPQAGTAMHQKGPSGPMVSPVREERPKVDIWLIQLIQVFQNTS